MAKKVAVALQIVFISFAASAANSNAEDWPQWRGPQRTGFVESTPLWPDNLNTLEMAWRVPLGPGYSGPIVAGMRVYVTETQAEKEEVVRALDRTNGKELWSQSWSGSMTVPFFAAENGSWIRSTPAFDGKTLYVGGMRDVLVALNAESGEIKWKIDFVQLMKSPLPTFGFVSSPLIFGSFLYVQAGGGLCKIDKETGKILWRTLDDGGGMMGSAFSSPVMDDLAGRQQLIVQTRTKLAGIDPEDGTVLWTQDVPNFRGMNILTPTVVDGGVFTSSYNHKSYFYRIREQDGSMSSAKAWENKVKGYMSTPILIGDHVYLHLQNQRLACIDLPTGKETWISSRRFGKYWSMVAQDDKILGLDQEGVLFLLKADPTELRILGEKRVSDEETWAHLAVSRSDLFIRDLKGVSCWHWGDEE